MMKRTAYVLQGSVGLFNKFYNPLVVVGVQRLQSTASTESKPVRITKNLSFRSAYDSPIDQSARPMVIVYGWLVAKARHMHKYGDFYLKKGYDVLHVKIDPMQLMFPRSAQSVVQQVVDFTQQIQRKSQPILVHGFSVGAYLYGETLVHFLANSSLASNIGARLQGQIMDSPVDVEGIPIGVSRAVTQIPFLQKTMQATISFYLTLTKNSTMKHYHRSSETFRMNSFSTPTLFLYSMADPIGNPEPIAQLAAQFKSRGVDTYSKCWPDSQHVSHFHTYPVEYINTINYFLQQVGLLHEPVEDKIELVA